MRRSMADIWSRSARIFSSGENVASTARSGDWLEPADLADAEARGIAQRDLRLVEIDAALDRVERAERRTVEVDLGDDVRLRDREMRRGRDTDARLDHAADHALDLVDRADVGDLDRLR